MGAVCFEGGARWGRPLLLHWTRLIDPSAGGHFVGDVLVAGGIIVAARRVVDGIPGGGVIIDAAGLMACPGFVDLYAHLRETGYEYKETIAMGARAKARGGFIALCCMAITDPPIAAYFDGDAWRGRPLLLRRARLIDPAGGGFVGDVLVAGGESVAARPVVDGIPDGCVVINAAGLVAGPGFKETIATRARVGAWGGFATLCCRSNADPAIDSESVNEGIEISFALAHGGRMVGLYQLNAGVGD